MEKFNSLFTQNNFIILLKNDNLEDFLSFLNLNHISFYKDLFLNISNDIFKILHKYSSINIFEHFYYNRELLFYIVKKEELNNTEKYRDYRDGFLYEDEILIHFNDKTTYYLNTTYNLNSANHFKVDREKFNTIIIEYCLEHDILSELISKNNVEEFQKKLNEQKYNFNYKINSLFYKCFFSNNFKTFISLLKHRNVILDLNHTIYITEFIYYIENFEYFLDNFDFDISYGDYHIIQQALHRNRDKELLFFIESDKIKDKSFLNSSWINLSNYKEHPILKKYKMINLIDNF